MYGSWDMEHDRHKFLSFWTIFCPFTPTNNQGLSLIKALAFLRWWTTLILILTQEVIKLSERCGVRTVGLGWHCYQEVCVPSYIKLVVIQKSCKPEYSYILVDYFNVWSKDSCFGDWWKVICGFLWMLGMWLKSTPL